MNGDTIVGHGPCMLYIYGRTSSCLQDSSIVWYYVCIFWWVLLTVIILYELPASKMLLRPNGRAQHHDSSCSKGRLWLCQVHIKPSAQSVTWYFVINGKLHVVPIAFCYARIQWVQKNDNPCSWWRKDNF